MAVQGLSLTPGFGEGTEFWDGFSGAGMVDTVAGLVKSIRENNTAAIAAYGVGLGFDVVATALNPLGAVLGAGVGWLIDHIYFLREPLDLLMGDNIAVRQETDKIKEDAGKYEAIATAHVEALKKLDPWTGETADKFRQSMIKVADELEAIGLAINGSAEIMATMGACVTAFRSLVRDIIAMVIGNLIGGAITAAGLAPFTFGASIVAFVGVAVATAMAALGKIMKHITNLKSLLTANKTAADQVGTQMAKIADDAARLNRGSGGNAPTPPPPVKGPETKPPDVNGGGAKPPDTTTPSGAPPVSKPPEVNGAGGAPKPPDPVPTPPPPVSKPPEVNGGTPPPKPADTTTTSGGGTAKPPEVNGGGAPKPPDPAPTPPPPVSKPPDTTTTSGSTPKPPDPAPQPPKPADPTPPPNAGNPPKTTWQHLTDIANKIKDGRKDGLEELSKFGKNKLETKLTGPPYNKTPQEAADISRWVKNFEELAAPGGVVNIGGRVFATGSLLHLAHELWKEMASDEYAKKQGGLQDENKDGDFDRDEKGDLKRDPTSAGFMGDLREYNKNH